MKKYIFGSFLCFLGIQQTSFAQYQTDALRYSQTNFGGSARFQATGGAATSLGGDISSAYYNPAGLGFNRKSEFSITPSLALINTNGTMNGSLSSDNTVNPNINQFGLAFSFPKDGTASDWKGGTFAITFTRLNNFNNNTIYSGRNDKNSIIDSWIENANNNFTVQDLESQVNGGIYDNEAMAYKNYLLNFYPNANGGKFDSDVYPGVSTQREKITETGSQNQWNIAYGANYNDIFYVGGGLGVQSLSYERKRVFTETQESVFPLKDGTRPPKILNNLELSDNLKHSGLGFNLNIGIIVRPHEAWRIGASFISPTWFSISETYSANLVTNYSNYQIDGLTLGRRTAETVLFSSDFKLQTPLRLNVGTSVIIAKKGFLSVDAEYLSYSTAKLSAEFNIDNSNTRINNLYTSALNLRGGGELRLDKYRLRLGAALYGTPYKVNDNITTPKLFITGGLGYYSKKNYFDLTIVQQSNTIAYQIYEYSSELASKIGSPPVATLATSRTNIVLTAGFFF
jgi:hypothetical protein